MSNGSLTVNDCFSGKIKFSDKHIQAYVLESEHFGKEDVGIDLAGVSDVLLEVVERTLDLATQTGVIDTVFGGVEDLYERLYSALMPSFLLASGMATWPGYWTSVNNEDFDAALNLMFGKEGSESRESFAGLIKKIKYLRERIVIPRALEGDKNLYRVFENQYGVEIGVLAGYGLLQAPITESYDETGDCTVDFKSASFGGTSAGVFDTLTDEYIAERVALGYADFISPDKKVDASTCFFPDTTWIIKNKHHDLMVGYYIVERFCQFKDYTVSDNVDNIPRFLITNATHGTRNFDVMTSENCADGPWLEVIEQEPEKETILASLMRFLTSIFKFITELFKGNINFDLFN